MVGFTATFGCRPEDASKPISCVMISPGFVSDLQALREWVGKRSEPEQATVVCAGAAVFEGTGPLSGKYSGVTSALASLRSRSQSEIETLPLFVREDVVRVLKLGQAWCDEAHAAVARSKNGEFIHARNDLIAALSKLAKDVTNPRFKSFLAGECGSRRSSVP